MVNVKNHSKKNKKWSWERIFKFSNVFLGIILLINVLPVLAPILQSQGFNWPAKAIYFVYSFMCHQMHWRSLHIYDHQCAWCTRDMAIWGGVLIVAVLVRIFKLKGIKIYHILPFVVPMGLDGGIQTIATLIGGTNLGETVYVSNNLMRTITGALFGIGLGAYLMPLAMETDYFNLKKSRKLPGNLLNGLRINIFSAMIIGFLTVFGGYLIGVQLWRATSSVYLPSNSFDSEVKIPEYGPNIIERRRNASCPVIYDPENSESLENANLFASDCFFEN